MNTPRRRRRPGGFSLIELLVSMAIGLVVTVAIAAVMVGSENDKRGSTAVNDVNQSGSYVAYLLDRQIRSAGSGFAQGWQQLAGCQLFAKNAVGPVLPRTFTAPSPFAGWTAPVALAPVVIGAGLAGTGGDLLMVMTGTGGFIETPPKVLPGVTASVIRLNNTLGFRTGDLVLIGDPPAVPGQCLVQQVGTFPGGSANGSIAQSLPLAAGGYAGGVAGGPNLISFGQTSNAVLAQIGNVNNNLPQFGLFGVDPANNTLVATDLLPAAAVDDTGQAIADGVVQMNAVYGTVTYPFVSTGTQTVAWVSPTDANYTPAALLPNPPTAASLQRLHGIVAIRIGLVLRTSIGEQKRVEGARQVLFKDLPSALQVNGPALATTAPYYRYRTVELTIPLRNVQMAP